MVTATFYYRSGPAVEIRLSRGYGEAELAHQLVTVIMGAAEWPLLLDSHDQPVWIDRHGLLRFLVTDRKRGPR